MTGVGLDAIVGGLLGTLAGDCVGAPYEGSRPVGRDAGHRRVARAVRRRALAYTDDTQLTLALVDHLVGDDDRVDPPRFAQRVLDRYDDRRGYGAGMRRLVALWRSGVGVDEAATAVFADGSYGNGAAMRIAPVALRWATAPETLDAVAARSARVSHTHPIGVDGAVVQARAIASAARTGRFTRDDLRGLDPATDALATGLAQAAELDPATPPRTVAGRLGTAPTAHRSVPAALWCAATTADVASCVALGVALGGDTDTVAAMAAAVRGAAGGPAALPGWVELLEGHDEMRVAVDRLHARGAATQEAS